MTEPADVIERMPVVKIRECNDSVSVKGARKIRNESFEFRSLGERSTRRDYGARSFQRPREGQEDRAHRRPRAAGGACRPARPASANNVSTYGSARKSWYGTLVQPSD